MIFAPRQSVRLIVLFGALFAGIWFFSMPVLFGVARLYMSSGVFWRLQWMLRRERSLRRHPIQGGFADFMSTPSKTVYSDRNVPRAGHFYRRPSWARVRSKGKKSLKSSTIETFPRLMFACSTMTTRLGNWNRQATK